MGLAWMVLIPLATVNVLLVMIVKQFELNEWWLLPGSAVVFLAAGLMGTQSTKPFARRVAASVEADEHGGHHAHAH